MSAQVKLMDSTTLEGWGLDATVSVALAQQFKDVLGTVPDPEKQWFHVSRELLKPFHPFRMHQAFFNFIFRKTPADVTRKVWTPTLREVELTNIASVMRQYGFRTYSELFDWAKLNRNAFFMNMITRLQIKFAKKPDTVFDHSEGIENVKYLPGARLNIVDSCFQAAKGSPAIIYQKEEDDCLYQMTVAELEALTCRVANGLFKLGLNPGDAIAIDMLMTAESVAIYLGIVKAGMVVVSIADSFSSNEIRVRLDIANTKLVFTQNVIERGKKLISLYERVCGAQPTRCVVFLNERHRNSEKPLRPGDLSWEAFIEDTSSKCKSILRDPMKPTNILFSSGTTGTPKAIPWNHTTPLKPAIDGYLHQDIHPGEIIAWPTNFGWMMGPWLTYAALLNCATIALYYGQPGTRGFCEFVDSTKVNMLGVIPSLVKAWRTRDLNQGLDWSSVRRFSSTGEASNPTDMLWLMSRANYAPVLEYCGGTELGGASTTGTLVQPQALSAFSTPTLGVDVDIIDDDGRMSDIGELVIVPPSLGISTALLNRDHHEVYYKDMPRGPRNETLRRHGDHFTRMSDGYLVAGGRVDDTMNLGGIKVGSIDIEVACNKADVVRETAAIAVPRSGGGPAQLVIFTVLHPTSKADPSTAELKALFQELIRSHLNPLFKVHDVVMRKTLPRTASMKVMRRVLRQSYLDGRAPKSKL